MKRILKNPDSGITALFTGALVFFMLFGFSALDINGCRLFSHGDPGMHYIGWRFFREAPWQIRPGLMNNIHYPFSISVIFTDSIPLMAVIFKLFRSLLPREFNYFGLWTLISFMLQGFFAYKILSLHCKNPVIRFMGTLFFILTPAFIKRCFWHTALTSHFLILASLYLLFSKKVRNEIWLWALLGFLCGSIHLYFLGICGLIAVFAAIDRGRREIYSPFLLIPVLFTVSGVFAVWLLGGFESGMAAGAPGFGNYCFNLNSFFNGDSWSLIFKFPYYEGAQVEGFAYLGAGMLAILLISGVLIVVYAVNGRRNAAGNPANNPGNADNTSVPVYLTLFFLTMIFAVSNRITFSDRLIFSFDISDSGVLKELFAVFRSSGRFAWTGMYLLMTGGFFMLDKAGERFIEKGASEQRTGRKTVFNIILLLLLLLQITDLWPGLTGKAKEVRNTEEYDDMLYDPYWEELASSGKYKHVVFMDKENLTQDELFALSFFAVDNGMTINDFDFGREVYLNTAELADDSARRHPGDCIYIFSSENWGKAKEYPELDFKIADMLMTGK